MAESIICTLCGREFRRQAFLDAHSPSCQAKHANPAADAEPVTPAALPSEPMVAPPASAMPPGPIATVALTPEQRAATAAKAADRALREACAHMAEMGRAGASGARTAAGMAIEAANRARQLVSDFAR